MKEIVAVHSTYLVSSLIDLSPQDFDLSVNTRNTNLLLTEREGRTGEYWPEVILYGPSAARSVQNDRGPIFPGTARAS